MNAKNKILLLIYAVPDACFDVFKLNPMAPLDFGGGVNLPKTLIIHAKLENPNKTKELHEETDGEQDINYQTLEGAYVTVKRGK